MARLGRHGRARLGMAWRVRVRCGRLGRAAKAGHGKAWRGTAGQARRGEAEHGVVRYGEAGMEGPEFLTPRDLEEMLRCGRTAVYGLLRRGEIPSFKVGRLRRIRRSDLNAYIQRQIDDSLPFPHH